MKIQRVKIKKFKNLENLEQVINGNNVLLLGDNEVGKSSFMQAIKMALGYTKHKPIIEEGKVYVEATADGKEYKFSYEMKNGKPQLKVEFDGHVDDRKGVIAGITGAIDFDVDEFVLLSESEAGRKQQVEIYKSLLPEDVQTELKQYETKLKDTFDERTEINREIKRITALLDQHEGMKYVAQPEVVVADLLKQLDEVNKHNERVSYVTKELDRFNLDIVAIDKEIDELLKQKEELTKKVADGNNWLATNKTKDADGISQQISDANKINRESQLANDYEKQKKELEVQKEYAEDFTIRIDGMRQLIADFIKDNVLIEGLSYDAEILRYNDVPVHPANLSTSTIMELGAKLKMHVASKLGILFIERAESLGAKRFGELFEMAKRNNMQLFVEQVERGNDKLTIVIDPE